MHYCCQNRWQIRVTNQFIYLINYTKGTEALFGCLHAELCMRRYLLISFFSCKVVADYFPMVTASGKLLSIVKETLSYQMLNPLWEKEFDMSNSFDTSMFCWKCKLLTEISRQESAWSMFWLTQHCDSEQSLTLHKPTSIKLIHLLLDIHKIKPNPCAMVGYINNISGSQQINVQLSMLGLMTTKFRI